VNGFLNAWFVDVDELCDGVGKSADGLHSSAETMEPTSCVRNADGSYDIEMVIEFFPQRWFYLGLLISGTTLLGCLGYLGYDWRRRRRRRNK